MSRPEEIADYINQLSFDLKAEMLVAALLQKQAEIPEINVVFEGQHKRAWSEDIECATVLHRETGEDIVNIHLNRDGLYDLLPEALFHGMNDNEAQSGDEMARQSREHRTEEKLARLFFQPFENELFFTGVQLAMLENDMFRKVNRELFTGMIPDLWKINDDLPHDYSDRLKKLLPTAYKICGDMDLTAQSLAYIIEEEVNIVSSTGTIQFAEEGSLNAGVAGNSILGTDFIPGNASGGHISSMTFLIGPLASPENIRRIKNGIMDRFVDCFYGYFLPVEIDVDTKYLFSAEDGVFMLSEEADKSSFLAYNSVLQ